jgi:membrane associated rhomboid family serine protease
MGYFGYLLSQAYFQLTPITVIVAILCLYYFGGLIFALFPGKKGISWAGHIFGFLAGIAAAYLLPLIQNMGMM